MTRRRRGDSAQHATQPSSTNARQMSAFLFLSHKRRIRDRRIALSDAALAASGNAEEINKRLSEWEREI
jgi:hypothetical protein